MIRKKKVMSSSEHVNLSVLPEPSFSTKGLTRDQLCHFLLMLATRRKMVETVVNKYKTNQLLCNEFSYEEIHGDLMITLTQVLNAWDGYWSKKDKKRKVTIGIEINSAKNLRMNTFGDVTGYLVNAFQNNIRKKYTKFKTLKRASAKGFVYIDSASEDEQMKNTFESLVSHEPMKELEYKQSVGEFIKFLREIDKKENQKQLEIYKSKELIPMKKKSSLARLFVALMNPRYKGNIDLVRENLKWTDYIFKRNKEVLVKKLRQEFSDVGLEMLNFAIENNKSPLADGSEEIIDKPLSKYRKLEVQTLYSIHNEGKKQKYTVSVCINEFKEGKWNTIKTIKKKDLIVKPNSLSFDEAKSQLKQGIDGEVATAHKMMLKMQG